jgi:hypothetical protein
MNNHDDISLTDNSVYGHRSVLPDSMSAVHRLQIHKRVEIMLYEDDSVCSDQIQTQPAAALG